MSATPSSSASDASALALAGADTYAVIVGVLEFADPATAGWSKDGRKDQALHDRLRARGVPEDHIVLLLDAEARHEPVFAALEKTSQRAPHGSTLLFYYAGHGTRDDGGAPHFIAYDTRSGDVKGTGIPVARIGETVRSHFHGARVFLMADACYSGALKGAADVIADSGTVAAVSLTSADASNLSTNNWTFTQTILDGLAGDGLMDRDQNGEVALGELAAAVADAMKYREKQRHGFHRRGIDEALPLARASSPTGVRGGAFSVGDYVLAPRDGAGEEVAQIRAVHADERLVRFYDYSRGDDQLVKLGKLERIVFDRYPEGSRLKVFWGRRLWEAEVLETDGDFHLITYPGWGPEWNEWVMSDRILAPGDGAAADRELVSAEWQGRWWPAVILKADGARYLIHYVGYGDEWDEWVTDERLRRDAQSAPARPTGATAVATIEVSWRGAWWPATVRQQRGKRYLVHYVGYGDEWDEWVGERRIRRPATRTSSSGSIDGRKKPR